MSMFAQGYNETFASDSDSWGGPMNGVDMVAQAGVQAGNNSWHSRITIDLWSLIIIVGALAGLWILGGVVFRRVNIF